MRGHTTTSKRGSQPVVEGRQAFLDQMAIEGFVPGTPRAYARELEHFSVALKGTTPLVVTVKEARDYLAELKRSGASQNVLSNASAALRFFFERVRHLDSEPVSSLRQRMIEDMELQGFSKKTQTSYVRAVLGLSQHSHRCPDQIAEEEIRGYFVHLTSARKLARPTITIALRGIKFFYQKTLERESANGLAACTARRTGSGPRYCRKIRLDL